MNANVPSRATFAQATRSEWIKLRTLRSMRSTLLATVLTGIAVGALLSFAAAHSYPSMSPAQRSDFDPTSRSLAGYILAQLVLGLLGALTLTSEYATGMIHTSLTVVPHRARLLTAKIVVFTGVAVLAGEIAGFASFAAGQAILAARDVPHASLSQLAALRAVVGSGLYLAIIGLLGVALGVLVRATAGAIAIVVATTFLIPAFTPVLPASWARWVGRYWPSMAGRQIMAVQHDPNLLSPWAGFAVLCAAVALVLVAAFVSFLHRDA